MFGGDTALLHHARASASPAGRQSCQQFPAGGPGRRSGERARPKRPDRFGRRIIRSSEPRCGTECSAPSASGFLMSKSRKASAGAPDRGLVIPFPRRAPMKSDLSVPEARAMLVEQLAAAVLSIADLLRGWDSDMELEEIRPGLAEAADRLADRLEAIRREFNLTAETAALIDALLALALALGHFARELRAARRAGAH
jgi:hypothetical protein